MMGRRWQKIDRGVIILSYSNFVFSPTLKRKLTFTENLYLHWTPSAVPLYLRLVITR